MKPQESLDRNIPSTHINTWIRQVNKLKTILVSYYNKAVTINENMVLLENYNCRLARDTVKMKSVCTPDNFTAKMKVPFGLSPVSSSHHALLSYYVRILFRILQLGIEVRVHGFLSLNPYLLLLSVTTSDQELVQ